jgi:ACS family hexuronate transporter-like MFS transporter
LASGIFNSGAAIGTILSMFFVPRVVLAVGWRMTFVVIGALGYVWLAVWWFIYRTPAGAALRRETGTRSASPWRVMRTRFLACFMLCCALLDPVWYFYIFWFPKFLGDVHGFDLLRIANTAWIPFVSAAAGNWLGGWFTGVLIKRGMRVSAARKTGIALSALLMTAAIPAVLTGSSTVAIAMISMATFGYTSFVANTLAFPAEVFPKNLVATAYGLASMGSGFGGMVFGWIEGELIGKFGYVPVFIGCGIMPLVALSIIILFMGPLRPHPDFQEP